ncbi:MAG: hypothetical protein HYR88_04875, partial [Verrucomicrobia bacterium]|nr:hypothetical protein [Verrucomicrobiota bacterium]
MRSTCLTRMSQNRPNPAGFCPRRSITCLALALLCSLLAGWTLPAATSAVAEHRATNAIVSAIPGGSLEANDRAGGHLLSRHVGKTPEQLRQRLASDSHISAASSFTDRAAADAAIGGALKSERLRIQSWLRGS